MNKDPEDSDGDTGDADGDRDEGDESDLPPGYERRWNNRSNGRKSHFILSKPDPTKGGKQIQISRVKDLEKHHKAGRFLDLLPIHLT